MAIASVVDANSYTVVFTSAANGDGACGGGSVTFKATGKTHSLGANPFTVSSGSATITVSHTAH